MSRGKDWRAAWYTKQDAGLAALLHVHHFSYKTRREAQAYSDQANVPRDVWHGAINLAARPVVLPAACVKAMRGSK